MKMFEIISNTLKLAYNQSQIRHKQIDDDWDIPLERIVMYPKNDFHRNGSQGDVFLGRLSNSPVAVKRVRDGALANIRHLKDLNHKNIIKFIGVSQDPRRNYYYIIMEWCSNGTLAQKLHDDHPIISPSHLCDFAQQISNGMKYLHSNNIIHGDLKPLNILLTRDYVLKISDFGTHKVFDGNCSIYTSSQTGTPMYMAPEVIRGESHSYPIDVWSYGVVLWEMFVGLRPYSNVANSTIVWAVGNNAFHLPIPSDLPEGLSFILKRCWRSVPTDRMTFQQICMMLKGATPELRKIPKERWPPTQAGWKKEARDELQKQLPFKTDFNEDETVILKQKLKEDEMEKIQKERDRNIDYHMKLQEISMLMARDWREMEKREADLKRRESELDKREAELDKRQGELEKREAELEKRENELETTKAQIETQ